MAVNSISFVAFFVITIFLYLVMPKRIKWIVLLLASYLFYSFSSGFLLIFLLLTTLSVYLSARFIEGKDKKKKKLIVTLTVIFNVLLIFLLKYRPFNLNGIMKFGVPLGISYYTLQAISYITDVYRGKYKAEKNFFKISLFLSFFPIITEGPISRYNQLGEQLYTGHSIDYDNLKHGFVLILYGYFKKMVIADKCALFVNGVFGENVTGLPILVAIILYTIQIYVEFSACIDIVRGIALSMGIKLEENFKRPFFSKDIQEFWRRWHITLGAWLRDYIFYPISLSKINMKLNKKVRSKFKNNFGKVIIAAFPLFFVWITNGVWHGVGLKYVIYGMYYYVLMILGMLLKPLFDKLASKLKINTKSFGFKLFQIFRTILVVLVGMLIFRADSFIDAMGMISRIFTFKTANLVTPSFSIIDYILVILFTIILLIKGILEEKGKDVYEMINKSNIIVQDALLIITVLMIIVFGVYGQVYNAADFIYGGF